MKRDLYYPSQPAGYNPAGTTRGALHRTPIQSSAFLASTLDHSIPAGLDSAPMTGPSHIPIRAMTTPAETVYPQTADCTATTGAEYFRPIPSIPPTRVTLAISSHLPTPVAQRDKFEMAKDGESLGGAVLNSFHQSILQSPYSYLRLNTVDDTNLSAVSDTPLPVKLPRVFHSGSSSAPGPSNSQFSRGTYSDQLQQNPEAIRIELRRLQEWIRVKRQYLEEVNKAKEVTMEQLHRLQLEQEAAREKSDREREEDIREHQARMRELEESERAEVEHFARINSELYCDESQVHFQRIYPRQHSRSPLPPQFCYPAAPSHHLHCPFHRDQLNFTQTTICTILLRKMSGRLFPRSYQYEYIHSFSPTSLLQQQTRCTRMSADHLLQQR